jgi:hypothetical protein
VLLSSGDSFPHLIQKRRPQFGFVTYLLNCPRNYSGEKNRRPFFRTAPPMSCNVTFSHCGDFSDFVLSVCDSVKRRGWVTSVLERVEKKLQIYDIVARGKGVVLWKIWEGNSCGWCLEIRRRMFATSFLIFLWDASLSYLKAGTWPHQSTTSGSTWST